MKDVILVCEDWFGLEVLDALEAGERRLAERGEPPRYRAVGYVSDAVSPFGGLPCGLPRLGDPDTHPFDPDAGYVLAIRDPAAKRAAVGRILARGGRFETVITACSLVPLSFRAGEGSFVDAFSIADGVTLGAYVTVCGAMLAEVSVGDYATVMRFSNVIGAGVGEGAHVADGSIVARSVRPGAAVSGIPAKTEKK